MYAQHMLVRPVRERVRLPELVLLVPAELGRVRPRRRLVAANAGDPAVEPGERAVQRLDLRGSSSRGRASSPRARPVHRPAAERGPSNTSIFVPYRCSTSRQIAYVSGKRMMRVEREDARLRLEREQQVEQDGLLLLEGAGERRRGPGTVEDEARGSAAPPGPRRQPAGAGSPPSSTSFSVSPRRPSRSVSSGMTSSGGMFPRLTFGPKCLTNQACEFFVGASKIRSSTDDLVRDLVDQAGAHLAVGRKMPDGAALAAPR